MNYRLMYKAKSRHATMHQNTTLKTMWPRTDYFAAGIALALLTCVFTGQAHAQQPSGATPQFEVSAGYAYTRGNAANAGGSFDLNGGTAAFSYNFRDRLAFVGDFGVYRFRDVGPGLTSTMYTYMFGPRVPVRLARAEGRFTPFAQVLVGGGRLNASTSNISAGENGLAMAAGGGLDISRGHRLAIRVIEAEYLLTRFPHPNGSAATQNNLRLSAGLVFRFSNR